MTAYISYTDSNETEYIIDSGSSSHMFNSPNMNDVSNTYKRVYHKYVTIANGHQLAISGKFDHGT